MVTKLGQCKKLKCREGSRLCKLSQLCYHFLQSFENDNIFLKISLAIPSPLLSSVLCHVSQVMCHKSHVTCQMLHVIFKTISWPNRKSQGVKIWTESPPSPTCHVSCVILYLLCFKSHMSYVMCHKSSVTSHLLHVMLHVIFKTISQPNLQTQEDKILTEGPLPPTWQMSSVTICP